MKKIWIVVTAALAVMILAAGVIGLPVLYSAVFDAESIIKEEEPLPEELYASPGLFMDRFRYPLLEETEELPEDAREVHIEDCRAILGAEVYERAFGLVGLKEEENYWKELSAIKGGSSYLIHTSAEKQGEEFLLSVALNDGLLPYLVCCRRCREPSETETEEAVERLWELCREDRHSLRSYIEEIDEIYEGCQEYQNLVTGLYVELLPEKETTWEISEKIPLWDCCSRGEWQVCSDGREVLLACLMGKANLVLYYDAAEKSFCGYRIQFAEAW